METNVITKIDFFDFMRCFFNDDVKYSKLTQYAKKPHFFMWRRMMAIRYPTQMNALAGLDDVRIMDVLHKNFLCKEYPKWLYTSSGKNEKDKNKTPLSSELLKKYSRDVIDTFMEHYSLEWKCLQDLLEFYPDKLYKELDKLDEDLHPKVSKSKATSVQSSSNKKPKKKGFTFKSR